MWICFMIWNVDVEPGLLRNRMEPISQPLFSLRLCRGLVNTAKVIAAATIIPVIISSKAGNRLPVVGLADVRLDVVLEENEAMTVL